MRGREKKPTDGEETGSVVSTKAGDHASILHLTSDPETVKGSGQRETSSDSPSPKASSFSCRGRKLCCKGQSGGQWKGGGASLPPGAACTCTSILLEQMSVVSKVQLHRSSDKSLH